MGCDGLQLTHRERHILSTAIQSPIDDPTDAIGDLDAYRTRLRAFRDQLDEMETADLRSHFQEFAMFIQSCVSVYGPTACAEAAIELTPDGHIHRCDVSMGTTSDPTYTGTSDVVVVIGHRPAISYRRIKDAVRSETDQQLTTITALRARIVDTPEVITQLRTC